MIVAAALLSECDILYSEDMQNGLTIEGRLNILNPFSALRKEPERGSSRKNIRDWNGQFQEIPD